MADSFSLDPQLAADTHPVVRWSLSEVLLMDDARFPWVILVPTGFVIGIGILKELLAECKRLKDDN